ncbi:hypothetical protein MHU86_19670 [Fragilaria crotonensis]|nr:hypothetical protein MHU86_19670 [Fragilaria crotonensis]
MIRNGLRTSHLRKLCGPWECARNYGNDDVARLLKEKTNLRRRLVEAQEVHWIETDPQYTNSPRKRARIQGHSTDQNSCEEEEKRRSEEEEEQRRYEDAERRQELLNRKPAGSGAEHRVPRETPARRNEKSPSSDESSAEVLDELQQHHINVVVNLECTNGKTALFIACEKGHVEVVQELLENDEVDVNARCTDDKTPLYVASENGHEKVLRKLLECVDVEVNAQCTNGKTALYIASENGHADVVRELLDDGDDVKVNLQCIDRKTALFIASENGHVEVVRLLHQNNKVNVNARCMNTYLISSRMWHAAVRIKTLHVTRRNTRNTRTVSRKTSRDVLWWKYRGFERLNNRSVVRRNRSQYGERSRVNYEM